MQIKAKVDGYYHDLKVIRDAGKANETVETYCVKVPSKNMLLDGFFTRWLAGQTASNSWYFFVGTGTDPVLATQTALVLPTGPVSNAAVITQNDNVLNGSDYIASLTASASWNIGALNANISEIGANLRNTTVTGQLDSRALIVDGAGNPTTVTVTPSDQLVISYTFRYRIPVAQDVSVRTIDGVSTTCTLESLNVLDKTTWSVSDNVLRSSPFSAFSQIRYSATQGVFNNVTSAPTLEYIDTSVNVSTSATATARRFTISAGTGDMNDAGVTGISYIGVGYIGGPVPLRQGLHFNPPLIKDNTKTITIDFDYTLARA